MGYVFCAARLSLQFVSFFSLRLNINNVSYVIGHKIINLELEAEILLDMHYFFFLLMLPRLSPDYIFISQDCKKINGNLHFPCTFLHNSLCLLQSSQMTSVHVNLPFLYLFNIGLLSCGWNEWYQNMKLVVVGGIFIIFSWFYDTCFFRLFVCFA